MRLLHIHVIPSNCARSTTCCVRLKRAHMHGNKHDERKLIRVHELTRMSMHILRGGTITVHMYC